MNQVLKGNQRMRKIKAKTERVLAKVKANYEAHKLAFDGYKIEFAEFVAKRRREFARAIGALAKKVAEADHDKGDKPVPLYLPGGLVQFDLRPPVDHSKDYEVAIEMFSMCVEPEIELDTAEVESYCMDRWEWKDDFVAGSARYIGKMLEMRTQHGGAGG